MAATSVWLRLIRVPADSKYLHLPKWVIDLLADGASVIDVPLTPILHQSAEALAEGNRVVFDEVGGSFSRFGVFFANLSAPDPSRLEAYMRTFIPAQRNLSRGMRYYYEAMWDSSRSAQLHTYGNLLVGLHEQTRLQPYIFRAFQSNFTITVLGHHFTFDLAPLATRVIMNLVMPNETMLCMKDVTARPWDGRDFPQSLTSLSVPGLRETYLEYVPHSDSLVGTAANNWDSLAQRMRWVWPMFRSRQDSELTNCPLYSKAVVRELWATRVPLESNLCIPYTLECCSNYTNGSNA